MAPPGFVRRSSIDDEDRPSESARTSRAPSGFVRRGGEAQEPSPKRRSRKKEPEAPKPARHRGRWNLDDKKWISDKDDDNAVSLGVVTVVIASDKALMITGGDTEGQNWIPRSQIFKKLSTLDRCTADVGEVGEVWVPQWLADKVPW